MATTYKVYNKASEFQTSAGKILAADFTNGVMANIITGLTTVHAVVACMNGDPDTDAGDAALITVDNNGDGTITVTQWQDDFSTAATIEVDASWIAVGAE